MMNNIIMDKYAGKIKGIYIHIPFCIKKCAYCDFLSAPADDEIKAQYTQALIDEIYASADFEYSGKGMGKEISNKDIPGKDISTVFFGGGTPSVLSELQIESIVKAIRKNYNILPGAEITIECNPGTVSFAKLLAYKAIGINRISFGLQSADDKELKSIGRIHSYEEFLESYQMARKAGFNNINIDLISALPNQTIASWKNTLEKSVALEPEHISAYSLILEEGTKLYEMIEKERKKGIDRIPCEESERQMYYYTNEYLEKNGYKHYEISNYAKSGFECEHNLNYWSPNWYLGFGIGAASYYNGIRYKNIDDIKEYISNAPDLSKIRTQVHELTKENMIEEFMFLGLRKISGISKREFYERFQVKYENIYQTVNDKLIKQGMLMQKEDRIFLTTKGIDLSNMVMSEFLL